MFTSLLKKAIYHSRNSDTKSVIIRWLTIGVIFFGFWSFFALILDPFLFSISDDIYKIPYDGFDFITQIISWFFLPTVLFFVFIFLAGILFAYKSAAEYFKSIYGKAILTNFYFALWKRVFGNAKNEYVQINSTKEEQRNIAFLKKVGGPVRIVVPAENAVVLEKPNGQVLIVGPTMNLPGGHYLLNNYELLKDVINLQNQSTQLDVKIQTKDGLTLGIRNLQAIFSIQRDKKTNTLTRPYPFNINAIYSLFYSKVPGSIQDKFIDILKCELIRYTRQFYSSEFILAKKQVFENSLHTQLRDESPAKFKKRRKFFFILRKSTPSFFQKRIHRNNQFHRRAINKIHPLHLDLMNYVKTNEIGKEKNNRNLFFDFFDSFKSFISPILEKKGFQLNMLSYGTIDFEKSNDSLNINTSNSISEANHPKDSLRAEINTFLKKLKKPIDEFGSRESKKENLKTIKSLVETSLSSEKGKVNFHNRQLEKAIEDINLLINSDE